ncbi:hypothetical protein [Sphingobium boeckii]|uniref:17 kDa surface antigen n=1 Tax=Sphingobium boeckii TaxID=1082345 RepID=A0A7W9AFB6_9SPHN|nr:hypothetical protein [Sphingobium boeckii]MBB5684623.1 hypothetical protein [Sphingobium boeckii]
MTNFFLKAAGAMALGAAALGAVATPAEARRGWHDRGRDHTGTAIVAGVAGLAIGAALASNRDRYEDRYYYRGGPRYRDRYYDYDRPRYRNNRDYRSYRDYRGYRDCRTRKVYDPYLDRRVKVRYCR